MQCDGMRVVTPLGTWLLGFFTGAGDISCPRDIVGEWTNTPIGTWLLGYFTEVEDSWGVDDLTPGASNGTDLINSVRDLCAMPGKEKTSLLNEARIVAVADTVMLQNPTSKGVERPFP